MTKEQLNIFRKAFKKATGYALPSKFDSSKVNEIEFYTNGMRGGRKFRFIINDNKLEYYMSTDYSSYHAIIESNGNIINLKTLENTEGIEKEILYSELLFKGLERNFDNPEFETNNVIRRVNYGGGL